MQPDQPFGYLTFTIAISAIAGAIGAMSALLGARAGEIVLGEMCGLACVIAFTLLIWAAIQDGKQPDRPAVDLPTRTTGQIAPGTASRPTLHPQYARTQARPVGPS